MISWRALQGAWLHRKPKLLLRKSATRLRERSSYRSSLPTWEGVDWMGYACPGEAATLAREPG